MTINGQELNGLVGPDGNFKMMQFDNDGGNVIHISGMMSPDGKQFRGGWGKEPGIHENAWMLNQHQDDDSYHEEQECSIDDQHSFCGDDDFDNGNE